MDERHWWIAGKIQESFHIGGFDNPTLLEDFICQENTLHLINAFLAAGNYCRIFFYCDKPEGETLTSKELHVTDSLNCVRSTLSDSTSLLYFLRYDIDSDVDISHMEREVFCGELKGNIVETLNSLLGDVFIPVFKAQKDWGKCQPEKQHAFHQNLNKFLSSLSDTVIMSHSSKQWVRPT